MKTRRPRPRAAHPDNRRTEFTGSSVLVVLGAPLGTRAPCRLERQALKAARVRFPGLAIIEWHQLPTSPDVNRPDWMADLSGVRVLVVPGTPVAAMDLDVFLLPALALGGIQVYQLRDGELEPIADVHGWLRGQGVFTRLSRAELNPSGLLTDLERIEATP